MSIFTISNNAFFVVSPSFNVGIVTFGGSVKISIISVAACLRKSSSLNTEKGIAFGKK